MPAARPPVDFASVQRRLRQILEPYRDRLVVTREGPAGFTLEVPGLEGKPWGFVAATRVGKRYVSFHLMGLYASPELLHHVPRVAPPDAGQVVLQLHQGR